MEISDLDPWTAIQSSRIHGTNIESFGSFILVFYFKRENCKVKTPFSNLFSPNLDCVYVATEQQRAARKWESVLHHHPPLHTKRSLRGFTLHFFVSFTVNCAACSTRCKNKSDSCQYLYTISVHDSICVKHAKEAAICYNCSNYCAAVSAINPCFCKSVQLSTTLSHSVVPLQRSVRHLQRKVVALDNGC